MKKVTMIMLVASALEFASSDAMIIDDNKKETEDNKYAIVLRQPQNEQMIIPDPLYEVENGALGMNRDIFLKLTKFMKVNDEKIRTMFGLGQEVLSWRTHCSFAEIRQNVFPTAKNLRNANKKLASVFEKLGGDVITGMSCPIYGKLIWNGYRYDPDLRRWEANYWYWMGYFFDKQVSIDECFAVCGSRGFESRNELAQVAYLRRIHDHIGMGAVTTAQLRAAPQEVILASLSVLAQRKERGLDKETGISDRQIQNIPLAYFKHCHERVIEPFWKHRDRLTTEQVAVLELRRKENVFIKLVACGELWEHFTPEQVRAIKQRLEHSLFSPPVFWPFF